MGTDEATQDLEGACLHIETVIGWVIRSLVNDSHSLTMRRTRHGSSLQILEVRARPENIGQIIGKNGQTAAALRTILTGMAGKYKAGRWQLEIAGERPARMRRSA